MKLDGLEKCEIEESFTANTILNRRRVWCRKFLHHLRV